VKLHQKTVILLFTSSSGHWWVCSPAKV